MVHDHHVGLRRLAARAEEEAAIEVLALETRAEIRLRTHFIPYFGAGRTRQVAQRTIAGPAGPGRDGREFVQLVGLEQGALRAHRLLQPREAEVVAPSLEQGKRWFVLVGAQRVAQEWQVLPDQLFLQVDRVGADDGALAIGTGPCQRRHQIGKALAHARSRLEHQHSAVVVCVGNVGAHVALGLPVLELPHGLRYRAMLPQFRHHFERVEPRLHVHLRHFHHDVETGRVVRDDAETHAVVVHLGRHGEVGARGREVTTGMVVQQHLARPGDARERQHAIDRAPRHRARRHEDPVAVQFRDEGNLAAIRRGYLLCQVCDNTGCDALGQFLPLFPPAAMAPGRPGASFTSSALSSSPPETAHCSG